MKNKKITCLENHLEIELILYKKIKNQNEEINLLINENMNLRNYIEEQEKLKNYEVNEWLKENNKLKKHIKKINIRLK